MLVHVIRSLAILTSPFLPTTSERILGFLGADQKEVTEWAPPEPHTIQKIGRVEPLYRKIEEFEVKREQEALGRAKTETDLTVSSQGTRGEHECK